MYGGYVIDHTTTILLVINKKSDIFHNNKYFPFVASYGIKNRNINQ